MKLSVTKVPVGAAVVERSSSVISAVAALFRIRIATPLTRLTLTSMFSSEMVEAEGINRESAAKRHKGTQSTNALCVNGLCVLVRDLNILICLLVSLGRLPDIKSDNRPRLSTPNKSSPSCYSDSCRFLARYNLYPI